MGMAESHRCCGVLRAVAVVCTVLLSCTLRAVHCFVAPAATACMRSQGGILRHHGTRRHDARCRALGATRKENGGEQARSATTDRQVEQPENSCIDRREAVSRAWKTALCVSSAALGVAAGRPATAGWFGLPFGDDSEEDQSEVTTMPDVSNQISYDNFNRALLKGQVERCDFYGADLSKAIVHLADGTEALIGEGYPQEKPFSDDSPMKVVAELRNAKVPFTTQFSVKSYSKPRSYKSAETLQAENRQRVEDETMNRLMAE